MKRTAALTALALLGACAKQGGSLSIADPGFTTPELTELVEQFEDAFDARVTQHVVFVSVFSQRLVEDQRAICLPALNRVELLDHGTVHNNLSVILFHELGHCVLHAPHFEGSPDIMNAHILFGVDGPGVFDGFVEQMRERVYGP